MLYIDIEHLFQQRCIRLTSGMNEQTSPFIAGEPAVPETSGDLERVPYRSSSTTPGDGEFEAPHVTHIPEREPPRYNLRTRTRK